MNFNSFSKFKIIKGGSFRKINLFISLTSIFLIFLSLSIIGQANNPNTLDYYSNPPKTSAPTNVGIAAGTCNVTVIPGSSKQADQLYIVVPDVVVVDDSISAFNNSDIMNETTLLYHTFDIIDTSLNNQVLASGEFSYNAENHTWSATYDCIDVPESSTLAVRTNFTEIIGVSYSTEITPTFSIQHYIYISHALSYDPETQKATVLVTTAKETYMDKNIVPDIIITATYTLYENGTDKEIDTGDLSYDDATGYWQAVIDLSKMKGAYYVEVSFKTTDIAETYTSGPSNIIDRTSSINDYMNIIYIVVGVSVALIVGILLWAKKREAKALERPKGKNKAKAIEIVEISKSEIKKTKLTAPPKKKVKKMDEKGLIFNVPTWEVDDEEEDSTTGATTSTASTTGASSGSAGITTSSVSSAITYTLHCPGCNSWYEIDFWDEMECPKCSTTLEVAMWCDHCQKWFDVPKPMDVSCPLCNAPLKYSK